GFIDPSVLQYNVFAYNANSFYNAGILQFSKRMRNNLALNFHYTWSKAIDETTDFNSDYSPNDQLNLRGERALSPFNQSHKVVLYAVYQSPVQAGAGRGVYRNVVAGWSIAPILQYRSWRPFNVITGIDNYGDNYIT